MKSQRSGHGDISVPSVEFEGPSKGGNWADFRKYTLITHHGETAKPPIYSVRIYFFNLF